MNLDLTPEEQRHVRLAMRVLRVRIGTWNTLGGLIGYSGKTLTNIMEGRPVTPNLVFKIAKVAGVGFDELLAGSFPGPGICPHCGRCATDEPSEGEA